MVANRIRRVDIELLVKESCFNMGSRRYFQEKRTGGQLSRFYRHSNENLPSSLKTDVRSGIWNGTMI